MARTAPRKRRRLAIHLLAPAVALAAVLVALSFGRYPLPQWETLRFLSAMVGLTDMAPERYELLHKLIVDIRLPRILAAILMGAALSTSGASFQAIFRNPLVSPGMLGVLSGASAGAAIGILLNGGWLTIQFFAFSFGILAVAIGVGVAHLFGKGSVVTLILGGILSGALFASLLTILKYVADPYEQLPAITYWLMGNLGQIGLHDMMLAAGPIFLGIVVLCVLGRAMDALSMGEEEAKSLSIPVVPLRLLIIATATFISALTVSIGGVIEQHFGWIGLVAPHVARLVMGPDNTRLLPAAACLGAAFLLFADTLARNLFAAELPIGVVTEVLGLPVFLLVLCRVRRGWVG